MAEQQWYFAVPGDIDPRGPVDVTVLRQLLSSGQVAADTRVWTEGMGDWEPVSQRMELLATGQPAAFAEQTPTLVYQTPVPHAGIYAGFWLRAVAFIIDWFVSVILGLIVAFAFGVVVAATVSSPAAVEQRLIKMRLLLRLLSISIGWLYYAVMESTATQATLGKMAIGLKVTDLNGARISFGRATARHFSKFLSVFTLFIGFMMAGWTERKQALHDLIAGTLVVKSASRQAGEFPSR